MARLNEPASSSTARLDAAPALQGKSAVVKGSTSGIGLGIARTLAEAGCNVMLNGFGDASAIENEREQIAKDFSVRVAFNPADLSKPTEVAQMIEAATREFGHRTFTRSAPSSRRCASAIGDASSTSLRHTG